MNHQHINEVGLVERYLMGKLPTEESAEFEAHFVNCKECVGNIETTKAFLGGLRIVANERPALRTGDERKQPSRWFTRYRWSLAFATGVILVVLAGAAIYQIRQSRVEAEQARSSTAEWQRRYEEERESSSLAESKNEESLRDLRTEVARLRAERETNNPGPPTKPPTFLLTSTRGAASPGTTTEIPLSRAPADFRLVVPLEGETGYIDYRVTIENDRGRSIWKSSGLTPDSNGSLLVRLNSRTFKTGVHTLTVEGVSANSRSVTIGKYSMRIRRSQ